MLRFLDTTCAAVNRYMEYLLFGLGLSMALLVAVQVFCRYILNSSLFWSEELARYMLVWLSFSGATVAYYRHLHPGVDALVVRISPAQQRVLQLLVYGVTMALALIMVISGIRFAWFVRLQITPALAVPKWTILAVVPVSGAIFLLHALLFFIRTLRREQP